MRVLAWAGRRCRCSSRIAARCGRRASELAGGTRISMALDSRERPFHCHHEKLVVVDDEVAYVGGIDLTPGRRPAGLERPPAPRRARLARHRAAAEGPVVADVARHFQLRWQRSASGLPEPGAPPAGGESRPSSCGRCPRACTRPGDGEFDPRELHARAAVGRAARLPREPVSLVAGGRLGPRREAARAAVARTSGRRAAPVEAEQRRRRHARPARRARRRRRRRREPLPRVHALPARAGRQPGLRPLEGGIVDDGWLTVGSANLNEHSLFNDTEATSSSGTRPPFARPGFGSGRSISSGRPTAIRAACSTSCGAPREREPPGQEAQAPARRVTPLASTPRPDQRPACRRVNAPAGGPVLRSARNRRR